ncbi:metallophosphoesterase family protein [Nonomuraea gerenzanensis]|uniref:Metallophosphoesterase n=1 Tax=Nonomuraea gerenzanensis TaxID=93944 RepID=A0A1M4EHT2_9ACTN|nr:metallophosphoesterase family protein [Nonomuraea gerenzanensis]UBU09875.1 metallophosphoesterase family protein [Nonomuraea gerenzanensis]SBO98326.1 Metallophosphoesterase [Nonomuraea gerenzanensis]
MRVAVLSDIHGVLPALEAVLAEPEVAGADLIVLTGDLAAGPMPVETLDLLVSLGERALWVSGNADRELVEAVAGKVSHHAVSQWAAGELREDQVALLAGLPERQVLELGRLGETLFVHATPRSDEEVILVDSSLARWGAVLAGESAATVVVGNTHMPFVRLVDRVRVVNPGSVGMPYGTYGAHWALLDGESGAVTLRCTALDAGWVGERLREGSGFGGIEEWVGEYVTGVYSDAEALRVFAAAEGRG